MTQLEITMVPLKELKVNPKNRNKHSKDQIERMIKLIDYQGFRDPIIVSSLSGMIVAGHGRYQAAKKMKLKEVPVMVQDFKDDDQELAFQISHNAIAEWSELDFSGINEDVGTFDPSFDLELLGIHNFTIDVADKEELTDPDEIPEKVEPKAKLGDIYQLGSHRLMCGDSTNIQSIDALMSGALADCVWTDPPYNVALGMESKEQAKKRGRRTDGLTVMNDKLSDEDFSQFLRDVFASASSVTKNGWAIYIAYPDRESKAFHNAFIDAGWKLSSVLVWVKSALVMGRSDYHSQHEPIIYGWKPGASHQWFSDRSQSSLLKFDKPSRNGEHPTMKPVELVAYCVSNNTKNNELILDVFGGSGSTLIAAEKTGRRCYMMELDPHYIDVIIARWEKYTGQEARLING